MPSAHNIQFRACRKRSGLSQAEVARLLGFSTPSPISRIEHAHREPDFKTALACEFLFGKPVSHIFAQEAAETAFVLRARVESLQAEIMALPSDPIRDRVLVHLRSVLARDIPSPLP